MKRFLMVCSTILVLYYGCNGQVLDSLKNLKQELPKDTNRVNVSLDIAEQLWRASQHEESLAEAGDALRLSKDLNYDRGVGLALMHQAIVNYMKAEFSRSLDLLKLAADAIEKTTAQKDISMVYHWTGNVLYRTSRYDESLKYYLKALSIRETIQDTEGEAFTLYNIANIYYDQKDFGTSLSYHLKSLALKQKLNDKRSIAYSYNNIANIYTALDKLDPAIEYYTEANKIFEEINNRQGIAYALGNLGKVYSKKKLYTKAFESLQQARIILEELDDKNALIEAHNLLAETLLLQGRLGSVEEHLSLAQKLSEQAGVEDQLIQNFLLHARLDSAKGNYLGAFQWYKMYTQKKESIFNTQKSRQIAEMQSAFELERKDREIDALNKKKELEESLRKNQQITFASIIIFLILASMGLLYILRQRQRAHQKLEEQKKFAEDLNRLNDKLFSIISHDLRSPLWSLRGVLEMASKQIITEKELAPLLGSIGDNTQHVIDLLENLLNWSRGHLQGEAIHPVNLDLSAIVHEVVELNLPLAEKKNITINCTPQAGPAIFADKNMIELVIRNLLSNAIKFTPSGGSVNITTGKDNTHATLSIQDTGVGIRKDDIDRLFGFQNFTTRGTENEKGTGLGLLLCKEFTEKNGGSISVQSIEGTGSTFTITIPLGKAVTEDYSKGSTLNQSISV